MHSARHVTEATRRKKKSVQFYLGCSDGVVKYCRVPSSAYVGNSCKESTSHPNIRQHTDTRCQSVPRVRGGAARLSRTDWRLGFIHHPVEMQFPLFLPEKLLGMFPRHVLQIKPGRPTVYVCEVKPRRCRRAHILDLLSVVYVPMHTARRSVRPARGHRRIYHDPGNTLQESFRELRRSVDLSGKRGSYIRRLSHPRECRSIAL